jgi:hypothetical protein
MMSFLQRELDRIRAALLSEKEVAIYQRLYAAQQALAWASEPDGFRSPFNSIWAFRQKQKIILFLPIRLSLEILIAEAADGDDYADGAAI